jgi:prepilin-type N-terminal cleavage/methylation domain-containing protein
MEVNQMKKQAGFTLVEIAIVMVIIGLLLGGVLKGQEILTNAKIKNLENDFNGITAAIYSYQDRYRALPGDDPRANSRFVSQESGDVLQGGGNGQVNGLFNSTNDTEESRFFWAHLRYAGLVGGEPIAPYNQPLNAFNGIIGVSSEDSGTPTPPNMSGVYIGFSNIPVEVAVVVESRSDDQNSQRGSIQTDNSLPAQYTDTSLPGEINLYFAL